MSQSTPRLPIQFSAEEREALDRAASSTRRSLAAVVRELVRVALVERPEAGAELLRDLGAITADNLRGAA